MSDRVRYLLGATGSTRSAAAGSRQWLGLAWPDCARQEKATGQVRKEIVGEKANTPAGADRRSATTAQVIPLQSC